MKKIYFITYVIYIYGFNVGCIQTTELGSKSTDLKCYLERGYSEIHLDSSYSELALLIKDLNNSPQDLVIFHVTIPQVIGDPTFRISKLNSNAEGLEFRVWEDKWAKSIQIKNNDVDEIIKYTENLEEGEFTQKCSYPNSHGSFHIYKVLLSGQTVFAMNSVDYSISRLASQFSEKPFENNIRLFRKLRQLETDYPSQ